MSASVRDGKVIQWKPWEEFRRFGFFNMWREDWWPLFLLTLQVGRYPWRGVYFAVCVLGIGIRFERMRYYNSPIEKW